MQTGRQQEDTVPVLDLSSAGTGWTNDLWGCFGDANLCILTCLVPCVVFGQNASGVGAGDALLFAPPIGLILLLMVRGEIRRRRGIAGSVFTDYLAVTFCHPCALVQEAREIKVMTAPSAENLHREYVRTSRYIKQNDDSTRIVTKQ